MREEYLDNKSPNGPSIELLIGVGVSTMAKRAHVVTEVVVSIKRFDFRSTRIPNFAKKSAPMIGRLTAAITKLCTKSLRRPRLTVTSLVPNVLFVCH